MGFADHYVPQADLPDFVAAIAADGVDAALSAFTQTPPPSELASQQPWIDECYAGGTSQREIVAALRAHGTGPLTTPPI